MRIMLYSLAVFTAVPSLPGLVGSSPPVGLIDILTALTVCLAWLVVGAGIAWSIGKASDLGAKSERQY